MAGKEKLTNSLECHVCFDEYRVNQRIWQCRSGHSVCQSCRSNLHECPFCKAPYEGTRNYAVEEIVREMKSDLVSVQADNVHNLLSSSNPTAPECDDVIPSNDSREVQDSPSSENDHTASSSPSIDEFRDMVIVEFPTTPARQNYSNPWVKCTADHIPSNAIRGGKDHNAEPLYIGRAEHRGALIPGKVNVQYGKCYVAWDGLEHEKTDFEILHNIDGTWIPNSGGTIPIGAFAAGHTENGESLYIGRARIEGTLAIGKVHPSHSCCYLPYGGMEYSKRNYEIFVIEC